MVPARFVVIAISWVAWGLPFFLLKRRGSTKVQQLDRRGRWGIALQGVAFGLVWMRWFRLITPGTARTVVAIALFAVAIALSWAATFRLGRQWRFDAGLNADHELVQGGAYRLIRHPIYASMLCLLTATGCLLMQWPLLAIATLIHIAGTEIRVRVEDGLLAARFGDRFREYQRKVPAYIPFIR